MMHMTNLVTTTPIPGSDNWHTAVVTVTPETADELLKGNIGNRRLSPGGVARYAAAMRKGDWRTSPEPLIFAPNGRLMNGQTRLHAVKATGLPQKFMCVFGVAESVFSVLDRGRPRSMADAHGVQKELAEAARMLATISFPATRGSSVADSDFLKVLRVVEPIHSEMMAVCNTRARCFSTAPFRAAATVRVLDGESASFVFGLYRNLVLGRVENLPPVGAAAIRAVLTGRWKVGAGHTGSLEAFCRAWNLFQESGSERAFLRSADTQKVVQDASAIVQQAVKDTENV
jgi:hypothetical protein